jgi:ABC-type uncharacterized transport system YnjBCD ATPase subunit
MLDRQAAAMPKIIRNFPERLTYRDLSDQQADGTSHEKRGRVILAGGEVLLPDVREKLLYPCLELLGEKYGQTAKTVIQTGGDFLDEHILNELLAAGVCMVSISSVDAFHRQDGGQREMMKERLTRLFEKAGMRPSGGADISSEEAETVYEFFGATPDAWIGKLWPSGRAWQNGLSTAKYTDNFCNGWSGALGFLSLNSPASEVAVDPEGNVYPCCRKTAVPYGNLTEERLADVLDSLAGKAPFEALTCGAPERMGLSLGVSIEDFRKRCISRTPKGELFANPCIGCDSIHREFIGNMLQRISCERAAKKVTGKGDKYTLSLEGVSLKLNGRELIPAFSLVVPAGEVVTIMGPSGSGKSSLLDFICGSLDKVFDVNGRVILNGKEITRAAPEKRGIGILFQDDLLFPHMSVGENLLFALPSKNGSRDRRREAAHAALAEAGLDGFFDRDPATLSGGQRARVAVMRTLLSEPRALLLDEPFSKLDARTKAEFRNFVFSHARMQGLPTLLVTHDPEDALAAGGPVTTIECEHQER